MASTTTTDRRPNRSNAEWDELARTVIVPALQAGTSMTDIRAQYGTGATIRRALMRIGYNTKGEQATVARSGKRSGKALAGYIASRRVSGASWDRLALETGRSKDDMSALLTQHGHGSLAEGRVIISRKGKAALAKAQAEAEAKATATAKRKRSRKPKAPVA